MRAVQQLRRDFGLTGEPDVLALLRLPGVIAARGRPAGTAKHEEDVTRLSRQVQPAWQRPLTVLKKCARRKVARWLRRCIP